MAFELDLEGRGEGNSGKGRGRYRGLELGVWAASKAGLLPRSLKSHTSAKDKVLGHTQQQPSSRGWGLVGGRAFCWREEARHTSETQVSREGQSPLPCPPRVTHGARDAIWPAAISYTLAICRLRRLPSVLEISRLHSQL